MPRTRTRRVSDLSSALESVDIIRLELGPRRAVFLDYDGTLTDIVDDPAAATIDDEARGVITRLAGVTSVAVVSGRSAGDVRQLVGLDSLIYAGSHGQEIDFPDGRRYEHPDSVAFVGSLDRAEQQLNDELVRLPGISVERKPFAIAVHYRRARSVKDKAFVQTVASRIAGSDPSLLLRHGKEIIELRPDNDWHKGSAISHLVSELLPRTRPLFIGDDATDEDGFEIVNEMKGVSVIVSDEPDRETVAEYRLASPAETLELLGQL